MLFKMSYLKFAPIFVQLKLTCLVTLFDRKLQVFKKTARFKGTKFDIAFSKFEKWLAMLNETFL